VLFTDRSHGNLSSVGGLDAEHGAHARERLRELTGMQRLARGYQVHGTVVQRVHELPPPDEPIPAHEADGQATSRTDVGALVLSADCLPVALACSGAVAMVHGGWRGLAAGVLEEGVKAIGELSPSSDIVAIVGPCAGPCCYEVGPNVHAAFDNDIAVAATIDLRAIAHRRLKAAGVVEVRDVAACTICDERFFSHRREGEQAGRQGGVAWLS
ncbi:MAG: polyphenol oxidase family protein, partial [Solirubrobacteraceae bacterium]